MTDIKKWTTVQNKDSNMINLTEEVNAALEKQNNDTYSYEPNPKVFHPSSLGKCRRQMFLSKLDQHYYPSSVQGKFVVGTVIHEWLEDNLKEHLREEGVTPLFEEKIEFEEDGLKFKGRADYFNPDTGRVVDFKTRANWYNFEPPKQAHVDQVHAYMKGLGTEKAAILYIQKKDMEMKEVPRHEDYFTFDEERWQELKDKAQDVKQVVAERVENREEGGYVRGMDDIPFENCGECYVCRHENEIISEQYRFADKFNKEV